MSRRRGRGEGSIVELAVGRWRARVSHVDGAGKRRRTVFYGKTKAEAMEKVRAHQAKASTGRLNDAGALTVSEYLTRWLAAKKPTVEPATYDGYERLTEGVHPAPLG